MMEGAFLFFVMITCVGSLLSAYLKTKHWSFYLCFHLRYLHQTSTLSLSNIYVIFIKHLRYLYQTSTLSLSYIYVIFIKDIRYVRCRYRLLTWCGAYIYVMRSLYSHRLHRLGTMSGATRDDVKSRSAACPQRLETMLGKFFRRKGNGNKVLPCCFFWRHNINLLIMSYLWIL